MFEISGRQRVPASAYAAKQLTEPVAFIGVQLSPHSLAQEGIRLP